MRPGKYIQPWDNVALRRNIASDVTCSYNMIYRVTQKKRELLKNPTKIEEIQEKKFIDRN